MSRRKAVTEHFHSHAENVHNSRLKLFGAHLHAVDRIGRFVSLNAPVKLLLEHILTNAEQCHVGGHEDVIVIQRVAVLVMRSGIGGRSVHQLVGEQPAKGIRDGGLSCAVHAHDYVLCAELHAVIAEAPKVDKPKFFKNCALHSAFPPAYLATTLSEYPTRSAISFTGSPSLARSLIQSATPLVGSDMFFRL